MGSGCWGFWGAAFTPESLRKGFVLLKGRKEAASVCGAGGPCGHRDEGCGMLCWPWGPGANATWPDASWVCRNEPQEYLGTLGGAEGSQKGSRATAEGCSGVPGCRSGGTGGCIPILGWVFQPHAAGEKLLVSLCHSFPSAKSTLQQPGCDTGFRKSSSTLVPSPPFPGLCPPSHLSLTDGETEARGEALPGAVSVPTHCPNPPGSIVFPARRQHRLWVSPKTLRGSNHP